MSNIILADEPLTLTLSKSWLTAKGLPVLYGGAFWKLRFQVIDRDTLAGKDLTSALAVLTITDGTTTITRKSGVTSSGAPTAQIVFDDQEEEDVDAGEGTGWLSVFCYAVAAEGAEFAPLLAGVNVEQYVRCDFELAVKFGDEVTQHPVFAGKLDVYKPRNIFPLS